MSINDATDYMLGCDPSEPNIFKMSTPQDKARAFVVPLSERLKAIENGFKNWPSVPPNEQDMAELRKCIGMAEIMEAPEHSPDIVEMVMKAFDAAVEEATEPGDEEDKQDWIDINDVRTGFNSRLTQLLKPQP